MDWISSVDGIHRLDLPLQLPKMSQTPERGSAQLGTAVRVFGVAASGSWVSRVAFDVFRRRDMSLLDCLGETS